MRYLTVEGFPLFSTVIRSGVPALMTLLIGSGPLAAEDVFGDARVIDASTLEVTGVTVHLYGIAAPKPGDECPIRGTIRDCGHIAATGLMDLTIASTVRCRSLGGEEEHRPRVRRCTVDGYDLSEGMVYTGWARALPEAPQSLHEAERVARSRVHGLWQGVFPAHVDAAAEGATHE